MKNPKIILLDEATSNVDTETETNIQKGLSILAFGRTIFVVAYRLSTVTDTDWILVIDNGRISKQGAPQEILARLENNLNLT